MKTTLDTLKPMMGDANPQTPTYKEDIDINDLISNENAEPYEDSHTDMLAHAVSALHDYMASTIYHLHGSGEEQGKLSIKKHSALISLKYSPDKGIGFGDG